MTMVYAPVEIHPLLQLEQARLLYDYCLVAPQFYLPLDSEYDAARFFRSFRPLTAVEKTARWLASYGVDVTLSSDGLWADGEQIEPFLTPFHRLDDELFFYMTAERKGMPVVPYRVSYTTQERFRAATIPFMRHLRRAYAMKLALREKKRIALLHHYERSPYIDAFRMYATNDARDERWILAEWDMMITEWEQNYDVNIERHFAHIAKFSLYRPWLERYIAQWQDAQKESRLS